MNYNDLVKKAIEAKKFAYTPYSNFKVGAALITEDGTVYTGANIENASYGATNCAERTAIFKAVSEGHTKIKALAVVGDESQYTYPCGICRQVMIEFATEDFKIIIVKNKDEYMVKTIEEILPGAFTIENLKKH
ncbi:cytidine deaminase [Clostridium tepidiprofundi DSM 19306]|uniref:Cytidine deaminase n=1 Tax=Clostridium tepidiprofundi DSM 19306 TaxID=1121338 RepID=A0A151B3P0_9CLOT|nr:cytidine deaminase [Clostridium tepidiprofundi]KYH34534.1 cytidine deaminase [Clostridium tepidiprofundi DSM 19306]